MSSDKSTSQNAGAAHADHWSATPQWYNPQGQLNPAYYPPLPIPGSSSQYSYLHQQATRRAFASPQGETSMFETHHSTYFPTASGSAPSDSDSNLGYDTSSYGSFATFPPSNYGDFSYYSYNEHGYGTSHANLVDTLPYVPGHMDPTSTSSGFHFDNTAFSFTTSAPLVNFAQVSGTLHQYACAKQRRSRHDPGGGPSQSGYAETPQIRAHHDMELAIPQHSVEPLPIASPNSSALYGAVVEVALSRQPPLVSTPPEDRKAAPHRRPPSPMAHLPYREDAATQLEASSSSATTSPTISPDPMPSPFTLTPLAKTRGVPRAQTAVQPEKQKYKRGTPTKVACFFCRKRKIACGGPREGRKGGACKQCVQRSLECYYPEATQRGRRSPFPPGIPTDIFSMGLLYPDQP